MRRSLLRRKKNSGSRQQPVIFEAASDGQLADVQRQHGEQHGYQSQRTIMTTTTKTYKGHKGNHRKEGEQSPMSHNGHKGIH